MVHNHRCLKINGEQEFNNSFHFGHLTERRRNALNNLNISIKKSRLFCSSVDDVENSIKFIIFPGDTYRKRILCHANRNDSTENMAITAKLNTLHIIHLYLHWPNFKSMVTCCAKRNIKPTGFDPFERGEKSLSFLNAIVWPQARNKRNKSI